MAETQKYIRLAQSLPPPLLKFFTRYPPQALLKPASPTTTTAEKVQVASNTSSADPNANEPTQITEAFSELDLTSSSLSSSSLQPANPFLPWKNPMTRRWQPAAYSLRRQAELVKLAVKHNVVSLLPHSSKLPSEVERRRVEHGLRVKGTGVGQKVKGKMWERTLKGRLEDRRKAMEAMPEMIKQWKERGHGRGWKKWPK